MPITYGDYIIIEIALLQYLKDLDLSTQSGIYLSQVVGKIEYQLSKLSESARRDIPVQKTPDISKLTP